MAAGSHILGIEAIERVKKPKALEKTNKHKLWPLSERDRKKKKEKHCTFLSLHSELRRVGGQTQPNLEAVLWVACGHGNSGKE